MVKMECDLDENSFQSVLPERRFASPILISF